MRTTCEYFSECFQDEILPKFMNTFSNKRTIGEYYSRICAICEFLEKDFLDIEPEDAVSYFSMLDKKIAQGELTTHTYSMRLYLYQSLARFINEHFEYVSFENPFLHVSGKVVTHNVDVSKIVSLHDMDLILSAAKEYSYMYYVIICLVSRVALSASNVVSLTHSNVIKEEGKVFLYFPAKGKVPERIMLLPDDVACLLCQYMDNYCFSKDATYLFYNSRGKPLSLRVLDSHFSNIWEKSGVVQRYTMKDVRSRAVLEMTKAAVNSDSDLAELANYTGLKSLRMSAFAKACVYSKPCPADLVNFRIVSDNDRRD